MEATAPLESRLLKLHVILPAATWSEVHGIGQPVLPSEVVLGTQKKLVLSVGSGHFNVLAPHGQVVARGTQMALLPATDPFKK
jgi:hypothetical protein